MSRSRPLSQVHLSRRGLSNTPPLTHRYGEIEFFFACLKVITLIGLIIFGIIVNTGGVPGSPYIGGRYWVHEPFNDTFMDLKPVSKARFLGFWQVLTAAGYSFSGMESLAVVAGEAKNPRKTMRMAVRTGESRWPDVAESVSGEQPGLAHRPMGYCERAALTPSLLPCRGHLRPLDPYHRPERIAARPGAP